MPRHSDLLLYLAFYFGTFFFHIFWHYVLRFWFERIRAKDYFMEKDEKAKLRYLEKWNSNWNHVIVMIMVVVNYMKESQECDFFRDDVCFMKLKPSYVCIEMVYIGYITENLVEYKFWIGDKDATSKQMVIHHVMVIIGVWMGLYGGFAAAGVSNVACFCEVSAIFLNYRSMWTKDQQNDPIPTINQLCFFVSYFIFRILLFPWCVPMLIISASWSFQLEDVSIIRKFCTTMSILMYIVVIFLNFFWFFLILKGVKKLLQEQGILSKNPNEKEDDRLNFGVEDGGSKSKQT